ncbi:MAG: VOC family protein [Actinomycetota bacterium]|nr:VOC family protein [Actinomycetota bacterium]
MSIGYRATRVGTILAVADVRASTAFYTGAIGFEVEASYDDPPYATLVLGPARLSLAERGHPADDRPGVELEPPGDPSRTSAMIVVEVDDAGSAFESLSASGVQTLAPPYHPPWGGCRFFCVDPDGYVIEIEEPA